MMSNNPVYLYQNWRTTQSLFILIVHGLGQLDSVLKYCSQVLSSSIVLKYTCRQFTLPFGKLFQLFDALS